MAKKVKSSVKAIVHLKGQLMKDCKQIHRGNPNDMFFGDTLVALIQEAVDARKTNG